MRKGGQRRVKVLISLGHSYRAGLGEVMVEEVYNHFVKRLYMISLSG